MANIFSRMLGMFSSRQPAGAMQSRKFHAARFDRTTAGWLSGTSSINKELQGDLDYLRGRARELAKNNEQAKKFGKLCKNNIVGPNGFMLQARVFEGTQPDRNARDAIERAFYDWARKGICDISGRMTFNDICRNIINGMPSDGEYLVRKFRGARARNAYGFALQVIDIDRLDTTFNRAKTANANEVVMGIELDADRRPVFYHIFTSHASEHASTRTREAVPAADIIHGYILENAEQIRGVPWMAASMVSMHHLGEFEKSALMAARKGANTLGFFVSPEGTLNADQNAGDASADAQINISVPGEYDTLPDGYDFRPYDSRYPDAALDPFCKNFMRRIANGFGVSYASLSNDLSDVNFSSIRSGVIEERDMWMELQNWFIDGFLEDVYSEWLSMALLAGAITLQNGSPLPASKLAKFSAHQWQGRRWAWVDPLKDIQASAEAFKMRIASPQMIAAQNGVDIEDVLRDIQQFNEMLASYQVTPPALDGAQNTPTDNQTE